MGCWIHTFGARSHRKMLTRHGTIKYLASSPPLRSFLGQVEKVSLNIKNIITSITLISNKATC